MSIGSGEPATENRAESQSESKAESKDESSRVNMTQAELDAMWQEEWVSGKRKHQGEPMRPYEGKEELDLWLKQFRQKSILYHWCEMEICLELKQALQGDACRVLKEVGVEDGTFKRDVCSCESEVRPS